MISVSKSPSRGMRRQRKGLWKGQEGEQGADWDAGCCRLLGRAVAQEYTRVLKPREWWTG